MFLAQPPFNPLPWIETAQSHASNAKDEEDRHRCSLVERDLFSQHGYCVRRDSLTTRTEWRGE